MALVCMSVTCMNKVIKLWYVICSSWMLISIECLFPYVSHYFVEGYNTLMDAIVGKGLRKIAYAMIPSWDADFFNEVLQFTLDC